MSYKRLFGTLSVVAAEFKLIRPKNYFRKQNWNPNKGGGKKREISWGNEDSIGLFTPKARANQQSTLSRLESFIFEPVPWSSHKSSVTARAVSRSRVWHVSIAALVKLPLLLRRHPTDDSRCVHSHRHREKRQFVEHLSCFQSFFPPWFFRRLIGSKAAWVWSGIVDWKQMSSNMVRFLSCPGIIFHFYIQGNVDRKLQYTTIYMYIPVFPLLYIRVQLLSISIWGGRTRG